MHHKVLYIAPLKDMSGYATAARGYLKALQMVESISVSARAVKYDSLLKKQSHISTTEEKMALCKPIDDVDVVIQHTTPNELRITDAIKGKVNIAVVAWETSRIPEYWVRKLNQFDSAITFCDASVKAFKESGVTIPIYKLPHSFDMSKYSLDGVSPLQIVQDDKLLDGKHIFYNISQLSHKKGIDVLIQSYYYAFWNRPNDVALVLKTYINNGTNQRHEEEEHIANVIRGIREAMRLPQYPPIFLITDIMTDSQIARLHALGDTYVCSSRGEGWNIPAFEALAYGRKLITTTWGGMAEFAMTDMRATYPVNYSMEPLIGQQHADPDLYTAQDLVAEPSIYSMSQAMISAAGSPDSAPPDLSRFDHSIVGQQFADIITDVVKNSNSR